MTDAVFNIPDITSITISEKVRYNIIKTYLYQLKENFSFRERHMLSGENGGYFFIDDDLSNNGFDSLLYNNGNTLCRVARRELFYFLIQHLPSDYLSGLCRPLRLLHVYEPLVSKAISFKIHESSNNNPTLWLEVTKNNISSTLDLDNIRWFVERVHAGDTFRRYMSEFVFPMHNFNIRNNKGLGSITVDSLSNQSFALTNDSGEVQFIISLTEFYLMVFYAYQYADLSDEEVNSKWHAHYLNSHKEEIN